jgi:5-methylthioadenosine/S-adenosylhomocysteine deaminase
MIKADLIILNGMVCTMNTSRETKVSTSIVIDNGKIIAIDDSEKIALLYHSHNTIDAKNCIVMPGLINTHTHSALTFLRGISDDLNLMEWLKKYIWPIESNFIDKDFVKQATRLAIYEMVTGGTTTFNDAYFYSREVAQTAKAMGVRCIAGELIFDSPSPIKKSPIEVMAYLEENFQEWKNDELVSISVSPHSLYACSPETIKMANKLALKHNSLLHIFVSESQNEFDTILKEFQKTPIQVLNDLGVLNSNLLATHCVYLTEADIDLLVNAQSGISHNPESNMKLGNGVAPISKLLKKGGIVGIGTGGAASNNDLSLLSEIDFAAKLQKGYNKDSTTLTSLQAVEMLTIQGAKALKLDHKIGSIEVGKQADIILIDTSAPHLTPMYDPYSHIVYAARDSDIRTVVINGKIIVKDRVFLEQDFNEIKDIASDYASKIRDFLK